MLVLDEATSSLDHETEKEIIEEIRYFKGEKTMIIIAHRLTTVQHCDEFMFLKMERLLGKVHLKTFYDDLKTKVFKLI